MLAASDGGFFYLSYSPRAWPTPIRARCKLYLYYMMPGAGIEPAVSINSHKPALTQRVTPTYKRSVPPCPEVKGRAGRLAIGKRDQ